MQEPPALEQVPSELSLEHFRTMRLEGTDFTFSGVLADNNAYTRHAIEYKSNGLLISGIMNIPKGDGPFPLIVLNHGFIDPAVYTRGRGLRREQDELARRGFAVLHTDYRGHGPSDPSPDTREIYDASIEYSMDSLNAIKAVRKAGLVNVDATHVGMMGHSLGGGVTMNIATMHPDMISAAILYAPVHTDAWENFTRWRDMRDEGDRTRQVLGTREQNPENWDSISSLTYLDDVTAPIMVFHGTNDSDVPKDWSDFLVEKMNALSKDITYVEYEGEKHEFIPQWDDFISRTTDFFDVHLREPIAETNIYDTTRVTKKPFRIFITPESSPVSPERFRGFHTGTDFEIRSEEDASNIVITALCPGEVLQSGHVNGYGGVVVQNCTIDGELVTVLYGHLALSAQTPKTGVQLEIGDHIAVLGTANSEQTDGERAHLHLSIHRGNAVELQGYVQNEAELDEWIDPVIGFDF